MRIPRALPAALAVSATALAVAACGSSGGGSSSSGGGGSTTAASTNLSGGANVAINQGQKQRGTLNFNPNVPNGYATSYYLIKGTQNSKGGPISGISTPNKTTIVFHLIKPFGGTFVQALTLPGSAPVPRSYVAPFDKKNPTVYDSDPTKQAFTGPYMIQSYNAGRSITLVRN